MTAEALPPPNVRRDVIATFVALPSGQAVNPAHIVSVAWIRSDATVPAGQEYSAEVLVVMTSGAQARERVTVPWELFDLAGRRLAVAAPRALMRFMAAPEQIVFTWLS